LSTLQTDSSRRGQDLWDTDEIVGGGGEHEEPLDQGAAAVTGLAQRADGVHPADPGHQLNNYLMRTYDKAGTARPGAGPSLENLRGSCRRGCFNHRAGAADMATEATVSSRGVPAR
jgi:hypothetical protein